MSSDPAYLEIGELTAAFAAGALSPVDVLEAQIARIEHFNADINAFTALDVERARAAAGASAARWRTGQPCGPLDGIVFAVKDNMMVAGHPFRRGSRTTPEAPVAETSPAVARCMEAGAVFLGLTTMPEFGAGPVTISPLTGITRNPWDTRMQPGGSSGGAAAAVCAGFCTFAIGSDAGGSIRIPAALTGVVGMKATGSRVPIYPPSAAGGLACIGPLARSAADAALLMNVICQPDARDASALPGDGVDYVAALSGGLEGLRIGWTTDLGFAPRVHPEIAARIAAIATEVLPGLGAAEVAPAHPGYPDPIDPYLVLLKAGYQHALRTLPADKRGLLGPALQEILDETPHVSLAEYLSAHEACQALGRRSLAFARDYDLLVTPTVAAPAFPAERSYPEDYEPYANRRAWTPFASLFNLTQQPAISIPAGLTRDGLPIGLHIVGQRGRDALVLRAAHAVQRGLGAIPRPPLRVPAA
ncbi:Acylamidase [Pigmentiphaga humi]|uniref:Acylamidase n=1 Tax=Pigmentiphaga humi TaxID=2478468 RepID=A0A3P4AZK0_9BURK|nr:amidase family protein [Pigmentiphaga humi]VCU68255.1 Acylamidase [Pigmentiphaga humi]